MKRFSLKNSVIAKTPRNHVVLSLGCMAIIAILCVVFDIFFSIPEIKALNGVNEFVKIDPLSVKVLGNILMVFLFLAFSLAAVRNDTKSQPVETVLVYIGFFILVLFLLFSTPMLILWAHINGYHVDHFESARRGGWYIFRLNDA